MATLIVQAPTHPEYLLPPILLILFVLWLVLAGIRRIRNWWKGQSKMSGIIDDFSAALHRAIPQLQRLSEQETSLRPLPGKWSKKETLGHLIDSASNNHQRFVRIQLSSELRLPGYDQEVWVATQNYQSVAWERLVQFWYEYNLHLIHLLSQIPDEKLDRLCFIGQEEPITVETLMRQYLDHLSHHLDQIVDRTQTEQ